MSGVLLPTSPGWGFLLPPSSKALPAVFITCACSSVGVVGSGIIINVQRDEALGKE